jgi:hypothetical protein
MRAHRLIRRVGRTLAAGLACFWCPEGYARGAALAQVAAVVAQDASDPAPQAVTLEFDLPPSVETKGAARFELHAVQIAVVSSSRTRQIVSVERSQWQIHGDKAQVSFQLAAVPPGSNPVTLRLRFLSDGPAGEWSPATSEIRAPETTVGEAPSRAPRPPKGVAPSALDSRSALKQATIDLLGPNQPLETALSAFNNVRDLALAVVISRAHQLKFVDLCTAIIGPPTLRLPAALRQLDPKIDADAVTRSARKEARTLLARDGQAARPAKKSPDRSRSRRRR